MNFDGSGGVQQGQPPQQLRPPMPPGHVQASPSGVMPPGHHQGMGGPPYHRGSSGMQQQGHYMPSPSQRQSSFGGGMPPNGNQFSSHPPLHQGQGPMHPMGHPGQIQHHPQMQRQPSSSMGMPPMQGQPQHEMRNGQRPPPPQQQQQQQYGNMNNNQGPPPPQNQQPPPQQQPGSVNTNWQSERDTPHRRDMIQHMYVTWVPNGFRFDQNLTHYFDLSACAF